jgi:hypothetical protein
MLWDVTGEATSNAPQLSKAIFKVILLLINDKNLGFNTLFYQFTKIRQSLHR